MTRTAIRSAAFLAAALTVLPSPLRAQPAPSGERFQGVLTMLWGDPGPGARGGGIAFTLNMPDGARASVDVPPALRSRASQLVGKRVVIRGAATGGAISATAIEAAPAGKRAN